MQYQEMNSKWPHKMTGRIGVCHHGSLGPHPICCRKFLESQIRIIRNTLIRGSSPTSLLFRFLGSLGGSMHVFRFVYGFRWSACYQFLSLATKRILINTNSTFIPIFAKIFFSLSKSSLSFRICDFLNKKQKCSTYFWLIFPSYSLPKAFSRDIIKEKMRKIHDEENKD